MRSRRICLAVTTSATGCSTNCTGVWQKFRSTHMWSRSITASQLEDSRSFKATELGDLKWDVYTFKLFVRSCASSRTRSNCCKVAWRSSMYSCSSAAFCRSPECFIQSIWNCVSAMIFLICMISCAVCYSTIRRFSSLFEHTTEHEPNTCNSKGNYHYLWPYSLHSLFGLLHRSEVLQASFSPGLSLLFKKKSKNK